MTGRLTAECTPQVVRGGSAEGLSLPAAVTEVLCHTVVVAYNYNMVSMQHGLKWDKKLC